MENIRNHWDHVYATSKLKNLGWFEDIPIPSLDLIGKCNLNHAAQIIDIGSGTTTLLKHLISNDFSNITALDISETAINIAKNAFQDRNGSKINWVVDDITNPKKLDVNASFDLWHDRTVLHFLTKEKEQEGYLNTLKRVVKKEGYIIIAVFSLNGARKCSGLDVINYDQNMISEFLGIEFNLIEYFPHTYIQPSGNERPYIYTLFQRKRLK